MHAHCAHGVVPLSIKQRRSQGANILELKAQKTVMKGRSDADGPSLDNCDEAFILFFEELSVQSSHKYREPTFITSTVIETYLE